MAETIAHGVVEIEVNDAAALAKLRTVRDGYSRTMREIDAMEADVEIGADDAEFKDAVDNAKREVRRLSGMEADPTISTDNAEFKAQMAEARAQVKQLDGMKATIEMEVHGDKAVAAKIKALEKAEQARHDAAVKLANEEAAIAERQMRVSLNNANRESRVRESLHKQRLREFSEDEKAAHRMEEARKKADYEATVGVLKHKAEVLDLQRTYSKLTDQYEKADKARHKAIGPSRRMQETRVKLDLDKSGIAAKMEVVKAELNRLGASPPVGIKVDIDRSRLGRVKEGASNLLSKAAGLSDMTIRLGPFTTSIKGAITALGFLGPTLVDVAGAATSLVGVLGTGLAGAAGIGGAAVLGFGTSLGGVALLMKPLLRDFGNLNTLQDAYHKQVLKTGAGSDKAKTKLKEFNHALGAVPDTTRQAFLSIGRMKDAWDDVVKSVRPDFLNALGSAFQTVNHHFDWFARNSKSAFRTVASGFDDWMKRLRSPDADTALGKLGRNANAALRPLMEGFGSLAAALGKIAASASRFLAPLANAFKGWADGLNEATSNTGKLDSTMDRLAGHAKDVGRLIVAAFRLVGTILNGSADAGDRMVQSMTNAMNRWSDFLQTDEGKDKMSDFFKRSEAGARALFSALAPLATAFVTWASLLSPFVTGVTQVISAVTKAIAAITNLIGLGGSLSTLGATLGAMWAVGKIGAFIGKLGELALALGRVRTLSGAVAALQMAPTPMGFPGGKAAGRGVGMAENAGAGLAQASMMGRTGKAASGAAREISVFRAAATAVVPAIAEMGTIAAGAATAGIFALGAAAVYGGIKLVTMKSDSEKLNSALRDNAKDTAAVVTATNNRSDAVYQEGLAHRSLEQTVGRVATLKKRLSDLDAAGKKNTQAYRDTLTRLNQGLTDRATGEKNVETLRQTALKSDAERQKTVTNVANAQDKLKQATKNLNEEENRAVRTAADAPQHEKAVAAAKRDHAAAARQLREAEAAEANVARQALLDSMNYQRGLQGLVQISGKAAASLTDLARRAPKTAMKIATKYEDPKDAGRVAGQANKALSSGVKNKIVVDIVANSRNAEQAVRRLQAVRDIKKNMTIAEHGGAPAVAMLERINGKKLTAKQARIATSGGPAAIGMLMHILGIKIPGKKFAVNANVAAAIAAVMRAIGLSVPDKSFNIIGRLVMPALPSHINVAGGQHTGAATGKPVGTAAMNAIVGEGSNWRGAPEAVVNSRTGTGIVVNGATMMRLGQDDAVIPFEQRYRHLGQKALDSVLPGRDIKDFARSLGVKAYAKGKPKQKALSEAAKSKERAAARVNITKAAKPISYATENVIELTKVTKAQRAENNLRDQVTREASQLDAQEPSSFLTQTGTTSDGQPIMAVDQAAINGWTAKLEAQAKRFDALVNAIMATLAAVNAAIKRIGDLGSDPAKLTTLKDNSVIGRANKNMDTLQGMMNKEKGVINSKASLHARQRAQERYNVYKDAYGDAKSVRSAAFSDWQSLDNEKNDIGDATRGRIAEAKDAGAQLRTDAGAIQGKATADQAASVAATTPTDALALRSSALDAQEALLGIGQSAFSAADIAAAKGALGQEYINRGQAALRDSDPANDSNAYGDIQTGAGLVSASTGAGSAGASAQALGTARADLYKSFGSNFSMGAGFSRTSSAFGTGGFGTNAAAQAGGSPTGGTSIGTLNATFPVQPSDPHTFAKGLDFELANL